MRSPVLYAPTSILLLFAGALAVAAPYDPGDAIISMEGWEGGAVYSREQLREGRPCLKWDNHAVNATISTSHYFPHDWSRYCGIAFWAFSPKATGQQFRIILGSDGDTTPWRDFYHFPLRVEWTGWRQIRIPFTLFEKQGEPAGWSSIDDIGFNATGWQMIPSPYTVLYFGDMRLELVPSNEAAPDAATVPAGELSPEFIPFESVGFSPREHDDPELPGGEPVLAPLRHQKYYLTEAAAWGYHPRFTPNAVSFDEDNRPYIRFAGVVQTLDTDGKWTNLDYYQYVARFVKQQYGWDRFWLRAGPFFEERVRFDSDGDAYMLVDIQEMTFSEEGEPQRGRGIKGFLLHSSDKCRTWTVYELRHLLARFEHRDGHNTDGLSEPPLILFNYTWSEPDLLMTRPVKKADGSLTIPDPVKIASNTICVAMHSGDANLAVTHGTKTFIAYGSMEKSPDQQGTRAYAVTYDWETGTLGEPVLVGYGGKGLDAHNWPAISMDSKGYLHVIIGGHHDPLMYTRSTEPYSTGSWTEPVPVGKGHTYPALLCDRDDTLYVVTRCSDPGYAFKVTLTRKKAGQAWEDPVHLVSPFRRYYKVWYQKLDMDRRGRLFLSYWSKGRLVQIFEDEYDAYVRRFPDEEMGFIKSNPNRPVGRYDIQPREYQSFSPVPGESALMICEDGETWRLAVTQDFQ